MDLHEVVSKLIGPIDPIGETNEDNARFKNLEVALDLVEKLLGEIDDVSRYRKDHQWSLMYAGKTASEFLARIRDWMIEVSENEEWEDAK